MSELNTNMSVRASGDGMFIVNGKEMDLGQLMLQLNLDRTKQLDAQIADQMSEIQDRNNKLKALNELLSQMRSAKAEGRDDDSGDWGDKTSAVFNLDGTDGQSRNVDDWMDYFGLTKTDVQYDAKTETRDAQWDANIEAVKGEIDGLNSDSQLAMTRMQSLVNKRNEAFDTGSNMLQNDQKSRDSVVRNLGG